MTGRVRNPRAISLANTGCTPDEWVMFRDLGLVMMSEGETYARTPLMAFSHQRIAARSRHIQWLLTLPEWWAIWELSGHWRHRGVAPGYHMCRIGDIGPYSTGNVFIGSGVENTSAANKKSDLPIGVSGRSAHRGKPFQAHINHAGRRLHLGSFDTVDAARAAYVAKAVELRGNSTRAA